MQLHQFLVEENGLMHFDKTAVGCRDRTAGIGEHKITFYEINDISK